MLQCLRVDLVIHLGQLCALRCRKLPLRAIKSAGVVLHPKEIVLFNVGQVVGKLLLPCGLGKGFAAGLCLQVVEREGQAHLDFRADGLDGIPCGGMGAQHQQVTLRGALADKDLGLGCAEHLCVFHGGKLHVSIIFWKFMPTCTVPSADFPAAAAFFAACSAIRRNRLEMAASCRPILASLMVQT